MARRLRMAEARGWLERMRRRLRGTPLAVRLEKMGHEMRRLSSRDPELMRLVGVCLDRDIIALQKELSLPIEERIAKTLRRAGRKSARHRTHFA